MNFKNTAKTIVCMITIILVFHSCRKEVGNPSIPSDQKVYLKSFSAEIDNDEFVIKPNYNATNEMKGYTLVNLYNGSVTMSTDATITWNSPTELRINNFNSNIGDYAIYTIPSGSVESERVPSRIDIWENGVHLLYIDITYNPNKSFVDQLKAYKFNNNNWELLYTADVSVQGNMYEVIYTGYDVTQANLIDHKTKYSYVIGNRPNRNIQIAREFYWLTCSWSRDEIEEDCVSPYWQSDFLPESGTITRFDVANNQWESTSTNLVLTTTFMDSPLEAYLKSMSSGISPNSSINYHYDWVSM